MSIMERSIAVDRRRRTGSARRRRLTGAGVLILLVVALVAAVVASLAVGAVTLAPSAVVHALLTGDGSAAFIVRQYRGPRVAGGVLAGAALGVAGLLLQTALRNSLASPDVVGTTKGAGLGAVLGIMVLPASLTWAMPLMVIGGGAAAALVLVAVTDARRGAAGVALTGLAVGAIFHGVTMMILVTSPGDANQAMIWLAGSLYGTTVAEAGWAMIALVALLPAVVVAATQLDVARLADESQVSLGRSPRALRLWLMGLAVVLSSGAVAIVGAISFLGLMAPHLASRLVGHRPKLLVPATAVVGALLLTAADLLGRAIAPPAEVPAGITTAVIGAPYLLFLLWKGSRVR